MKARLSAVAVWIGAVVLAGGGAVGASNGLRQLSELTQQRDAAQGRAAEAAAEIAALREQIAMLQASLALERRERVSAQKMLGMTRGLWKNSLDRLEDAEGTQTLVTRENAVLRKCLGGTLQALPLLSEGDAMGAMHVMMSVDPACRQAQQALFRPATAAGR